MAPRAVLEGQPAEAAPRVSFVLSARTLRKHLAEHQPQAHTKCLKMLLAEHRLQARWTLSGQNFQILQQPAVSSLLQYSGPFPTGLHVLQGGFRSPQAAAAGALRSQQTFTIASAARMSPRVHSVDVATLKPLLQEVFAELSSLSPPIGRHIPAM